MKERRAAAGWILFAIALLTLAAASPFINLTVTEIGVLRAQGTNLFTANSNALNSSVNLSSRSATGHTHAASDVTSGTFAVARLGSGTPNGSNFLRGDGSFAQVSTNDVPGLVAALAAGGGGGGGTDVTINGGSALSSANFETTSSIAFSEVLGTIYATVVNGSIGTSRLSEAASEYLRNRTNGIGTQPLSTISDAGTLASASWPSSDGQEYVAKDGAWALKTGGSGTINLVSVSTNGLAPQITYSNAVLTASATGVPTWVPNRMTATLASFRAQQGEPPASSYATFSTRNSIGVLLYDETVFTSSRFRWVVPEGFSGSTVTVVLKWTTSATSGDGTFVVENAKLTGDIDSITFATGVTNTVTTSSTAGTVMTTTLTGVSTDGASAGDWIWTAVRRIDDSINSNDLELHAVEVRSE